MWLLNSSVGRKIVMSLSGLFLILFVTFHVLMNAVALISPAGYNAVCHFLGANWYALIGTAVLAAGFIIHIIYAFWLTLQNRKARGNDQYAISKKPKTVEWASQNMLALGIVVLAFFAVHLYQFWGRMQLQELLGTQWVAPCGQEIHPADGAAFLYIAFKDWWTLVIYLIGFGALWFHMTHGFWSAFQSLGTNNNKWMGRLKSISCAWATVVCLLFAVEAVAFTLMANCDECKGKLLNANETECVVESDACGHHHHSHDAAHECTVECENHK